MFLKMKGVLADGLYYKTYIPTTRKELLQVSKSHVSGNVHVTWCEQLEDMWHGVNN